MMETGMTRPIFGLVGGARVAWALTNGDILFRFFYFVSVG